MATILDLQVGAGANDGFVKSNGDGDNAWGSLPIGWWSSLGFYLWHLWESVPIPAGATITTAYMSVKAYATQDEAGNIATNVYFNNVDSASNPASNKTAYDAKAVTAGVAWDVTSTTWTKATWYNSPELKTILQTVIDRAGWASGNNLMILWKDDGSASYKAIDHYDVAAANAPKLHIEYTVPSIPFFRAPMWGRF
jgi:hypothetical protein